MRRPISSGCKEQMFDQQHQYNDVYTAAVSSSSSTAIHGSTCISSLSSLISINLQVFRRQFGASVQVLHICQQSLLHASSDTAIRYYLIINYNIYVLVFRPHTHTCIACCLLCTLQIQVLYYSRLFQKEHNSHLYSSQSMYTHDRGSGD